ncbi:MAG: hypothetical protein KBC22_00330 [Candidatus Pacebacteria bacterium]|nr:hypothetical protein [Candidatus Paceibacterota bacterium]
MKALQDFFRFIKDLFAPDLLENAKDELRYYAHMIPERRLKGEHNPASSYYFFDTYFKETGIDFEVKEKDVAKYAQEKTYLVTLLGGYQIKIVYERALMIIESGGGSETISAFAGGDCLMEFSLMNHEGVVIGQLVDLDKFPQTSFVIAWEE